MNQFQRFLAEMRKRSREDAAVLEAPFAGLAARYSSPQLPAHGETAAVALRCPKTAALFYDRVWAADAGSLPLGVGFHGSSSFEIQGALTATALFDTDGSAVSDIPMRDEFLGSLMGIVRQASDAAHDGDINIGLERVLAESIKRDNGVHVVPVYGSIDQREAVYTPGDCSVIIATLRNLPVIDEMALTWDQVVEFRADAVMKRKLSRFVHWLDASMVGKSQAFVEAEVAARLEDYSMALRKHGISTVYGALSALIDARSLIASAAAVTASTYAGEPWWGLVASGLVVGGKCVLDLSKAWVDYRFDTKMINPEIAFVAEMRARLGSTTV